MSNAYRLQRINGVLKREISVILQKEFKDPRVGMVTISEVVVSKDLSNAKVFFFMMDEQEVEKTEKILNAAAGFFRSKLAHSVILRTVPKLNFKYDDSLAKGGRIDSLLDDL